MAVAIAGAFSTITATAGPVLAPYTPTSPIWTYPVVVTVTSNSTTESTGLTTIEPLYVDWCVANSGNATVSVNCYLNLYVDNTLISQWNLDGLPASTYEFVTGQSIGNLSAGTHTVGIQIDPTHAISSTTGGYTNTISVSAVLLGAPTPLAPANASTGQFTVPLFIWSPVANATSYRVLVATVASDLPTSATATNGGASVLLDAVAPNTNFCPTIQLSPNTTYYWEVHARAGGDDGTWTSVQSFTTGSGGNGITIIPTFDSSITSDPQAATIEATINAAIAVYHQNFSDPVTVNFTYVEDPSISLGENDSYYITVPYTSYRAALVSHTTTADDTTALANLPATANNPVNNNGSVNLKNALGKALGFSVIPETADSTVYLNTSVMNLSSLETDSTNFSLFSTVSHEMDEALGLGSALNGLSNGSSNPTGPVEPEDLFRYDQNGNRSLTTSLSATSYFSLNGTNDLAQFNQFDGGDFGDWYTL